MSESMLAAVHEAAQPLAVATPTQPPATPPEQTPKGPVVPPLKPTAEAGAIDTSADAMAAIRTHASGLAELYGLAHPASAAAFTSLAADIKAGKSEADVSKTLLAGRQAAGPDTQVDGHRSSNTVLKPGASAPVTMPSHADVYGELNGQPRKP